MGARWGSGSPEYIQWLPEFVVVTNVSGTIPSAQVRDCPDREMSLPDFQAGEAIRHARIQEVQIKTSEGLAMSLR